MSYDKFKPTVWSKYIQTQIKSAAIFKNDCDFKFEEEAAKGKKIKILGVEAPYIGKYSPGHDIDSPEEILGTEMYLEINQYDYFNYGVDNIDKAQSVDGLMEALSKEATRALAESEDEFIAREICNNCTHDAGAFVVKTPEDAKAVVDKLFVSLWNLGVSAKDDLCLYVKPWFYDLLESRLVELKTDNVKQLENGLVGTYRGAKVKMANALPYDDEGDFMILKTSKAYAFCNGIEEVKAYSPEKRFMDAVKGLNVYGGKIVRPNEVAVLRVRDTDEPYV